MKTNIQNIAIVGGGFSGLTTASRLMQLAQENKEKITITMFEKLPVTKNGAFDIHLSKSFTLNHEADFMGCVNPWNKNANTNDFYLWIQEVKDEPLKILKGKTITETYKDIDLENPKAFLPRSLYGLYLNYRLNQLIANSIDSFYSFRYKEDEVINIARSKNNFIVKTKQSQELFDCVILCTGCVYPIRGEDNLLFAQNMYIKIDDLDLIKNKTIGILGSALSGIEIAIALADRGYKDIMLFSRTGRLPKVRGKSNQYRLQYVTSNNLYAIKKQDGYFNFLKFLDLMKKEFLYAYKQAKEGLYQAKGINLKKILENTSPLIQFEEDIKIAKSDKEIIWRSVCLSLAKNKPLIFPYIAPEDESIIFKKFSSFILSYLTPLPLPQAEKLQTYIERGVIKPVANITSYEYKNPNWKITTGKNVEYFCKYLIDTRGPLQDVESNQLICSLLANNLVEKSSIRSLRVNEEFQSIVSDKKIPNFYVLGSVMKVYAPINNSTIYLEKYIDVICQSIFNNYLIPEKTTNINQLTRKEYIYEIL